MAKSNQTTCSLCGTVQNQLNRTRPEGDHGYCDECWDTFEKVKESGVYIRGRHFNRSGRKWSYAVTGAHVDETHNQVKALAVAKDKMERRGCRGLFRYPPSGSRWLVDEYLEAHPGIAEDVERERASLIGWVTDRLPF